MSGYRHHQSSCNDATQSLPSRLSPSTHKSSTKQLFYFILFYFILFYLLYNPGAVQHEPCVRVLSPVSGRSTRRPRICRFSSHVVLAKLLQVWSHTRTHNTKKKSSQARTGAAFFFFFGNALEQLWTVIVERLTLWQRQRYRFCFQENGSTQQLTGVLLLPLFNYRRRYACHKFNLILKKYVQYLYF
jgi:hypothetical protein